MALGAGAAVALVLPFLCIWWELRSLRRQAELSELQSLRSYLQRVEDENEKAEDFLSHLWAQPAEPFPADKAVSNVTVITVDTSKPLESFNMLGASGVAVLNAAVGEDWHSWRDKTRLYYKFLKKFAVENPGRWVVLVDGFDTIFGGCSEEKLLEFFNRTVSAAGGEERSVVWGAENCCFPWRDSCSEYMHLTARRQAVLQEFGMKEAFEKLGDCRRCRDLDLPGYDSFCSSPPAYQHLNSGFLMGRAEHVLQSVSAWLKLYSNHSETDQLVARDLFLQHSNRPFLPFMTLDYSGALVLTVGNIPESAIPEVFSIRENGIYNLQTGLVQCFIHGAGPGKAFVAQLLRSQR